MKNSTNSILACVLLFACNTPNFKSTIDNELEGRWKYNTVERKTDNKWTTDLWMKDGTGYLIYNNKGHMAMHITPEGYSDTKIIWNRDSLGFSTWPLFELMQEETGVYSLSNFVFTGNYMTSGDTLVHERLSHGNPQYFNHRIERRYKIDSDTLFIYPHIPNPFVRVVWIRND